MAKYYSKIYSGFVKTGSQDHSKEIKEILLNSKITKMQEDEIDEMTERVEDYHYTVVSYKNEIDRLNESVGSLTTEVASQNWELDRCHGVERDFIEYKNRLEGSRKMRLLRKIKFIDY